MKKIKYIVGITLIIITMVAIKLYKKYNRQQLHKQENIINTEQIFKLKRERDSIKRAKIDSVNRQKNQFRQDSLRNELNKKRAKTDSILKALQKNN